MQHAAECLTAVKMAVGRLDDFAYSLVLRFNAVKRRHAEAHMGNGGCLYVACSFAVDAAEERWLIWSISIEWTAPQCTLQAFAEEEDADGTKHQWESAQFRAATLEEFKSSLARAHEAIEGSLALPWVADIFNRWKNEKKA